MLFIIVVGGFFVCLFVCLFVSLFVCLFVCLFNCLYWSPCIIRVNFTYWNVCCSCYNIQTICDLSFSGMQFSTKDNDNDRSTFSCSQRYKGAWWYNACHRSNLNGLYLNGSHSSYADGVDWSSFRGHYYSLKHAEMKVKTKC